jgi:hypothetical protein
MTCRSFRHFVVRCLLEKAAGWAEYRGLEAAVDVEGCCCLGLAYHSVATHLVRACERACRLGDLLAVVVACALAIADALVSPILSVQPSGLSSRGTLVC